jgi:uncharacterized membrane-anchored protein YjiN (DUF445 family)
VALERVNAPEEVVSSTLGPPPDELLKQQRLDRMKRIATSLLGLSTLIFIIARFLERRWPLFGFLRATAEAAMIGGLADWFAVTALFKHPLGLKIPHTAIVPNRKDQVGRNLGTFVQRHFLSADVVAAKLRSARVAEYLAQWAAEPENAQMLARQMASALATAAKATQQETVRELIESSISRKVERTAVAPLLGKALSVVTAENRHQELFDEVIALLSRAVSNNRDFIRERIDAESPWWIPEPIDEKIAEKVVKSIDRTLRQIRDHEDHPMRERFDIALKEFIERLQTSPEVIQRAEAIKQDILNAEAVREFSSNLWDDMRDALVRHSQKDDSAGIQAIAHGIQAFGEAVQHDPELLAKIDRWIVDMVSNLIHHYRDDVAALIADTIKGWDPDATSRRIELAIGRDLQFIRINGTLVGGLAGLLIYCLTLVF